MIYDHPLYHKLRPFFDEPDIYNGCAFGLPIHMRRNTMKAWCGYVGVPPHHPLHGMGYSDRVHANLDEIKLRQQSPVAILIEACKDDDEQVSLDVLFDCPGGLTWANPNVPLGGHRQGWWYFGFDCSHYNDLTPKDIIDEMVTGAEWRQGVYRDFDFVLRACRSLAEQLAHYEELK